MEFNVDRMQVLSGVKSKDEIMSESKKVINESTQDMLAEEKIRQLIREEIQAYLHERKSSSMNQGFTSGRLGPALGFSGPGFDSKPSSSNSNAAYARGPGRSFGFGGPGFM